MRARHLVLLDPRQPLAGPVTQPHLRWLAGGGTGDDQALAGIFNYIGAEEGRLRDNPAGVLGGLLKGVLGN